MMNLAASAVTSLVRLKVKVKESLLESLAVLTGVRARRKKGCGSPESRKTIFRTIGKFFVQQPMYLLSLGLFPTAR